MQQRGSEIMLLPHWKYFEAIYKSTLFLSLPAHGNITQFHISTIVLSNMPLGWNNLPGLWMTSKKCVTSSFIAEYRTQPTWTAYKSLLAILRTFLHRSTYVSRVFTIIVGYIYLKFLVIPGVKHSYEISRLTLYSV